MGCETNNQSQSERREAKNLKQTRDVLSGENGIQNKEGAFTSLPGSNNDPKANIENTESDTRDLNPSEQPKPGDGATNNETTTINKGTSKEDIIKKILKEGVENKEALGYYID